MAQTSIEWTEMSWNPTTGCTKISAGCRFCYAEVMARRLQAMGNNKYANGFKLTLHPDTLTIPYQWKKPKFIFVNSMSDLFHEGIPLSYFKKVFKVMNDNSHHVFQVLTKRADRIAELNDEVKWTPNIWMGVTVENNDVVDRIEYLRECDAKTKYLSCEPLIGPIHNLDLRDIDWVIAGGESGRTPRPMEKEWIVRIQQLCHKSNVAFFFKQWGGTNKKKNGSSLNGKTYKEMPSFDYM